MPPKVPRLRWDDPLRALDVLGSLWSSTGLPSVTSVSAQAVAVPYRTLFTTLQQLLVGKRVTIRMGDHDVTLTVTELDSELEPRGLAVGQLGEVRVAARDIEWGQQRLQRAVAVLRNVHIRPGVPPAGGRRAGRVVNGAAGRDIRRDGASGGAAAARAAKGGQHSPAALGAPARLGKSRGRRQRGRDDVVGAAARAADRANQAKAMETAEADSRSSGADA